MAAAKANSITKVCTARIDIELVSGEWGYDEAGQGTSGRLV